VGLLFVIFGLAMLGAVRLPVGWLTRIGAGRRVRGGGLLPVFLMGTASGFLAAPCTVPVTFALLTYVAINQRALTGFALFFLFAAGMGSPLLVLGTMTAVPAAFNRARRWTPVVQKFLAAGLVAWGVYLFAQGLRRW
jgi:thiol:disulfide interchange protein DsbD